jgi:hypothetical protein
VPTELGWGWGVLGGWLAEFVYNILPTMEGGKAQWVACTPMKQKVKGLIHFAENNFFMKKD